MFTKRPEKNNKIQQLECRLLHDVLSRFHRTWTRFLLILCCNAAVLLSLSTSDKCESRFVSLKPIFLRIVFDSTELNRSKQNMCVQDTRNLKLKCGNRCSSCHFSPPAGIWSLTINLNNCGYIFLLTDTSFDYDFHLRRNKTFFFRNNKHFRSGTAINQNYWTGLCLQKQACLCRFQNNGNPSEKRHFTI